MDFNTHTHRLGTLALLLEEACEFNYPHSKDLSLWGAFDRLVQLETNFGLKIRRRSKHLVWLRREAHLHLNCKLTTSKNRRRHHCLPLSEIRRTFIRKSRPWYQSVLISPNQLIASRRQAADNWVRDWLNLRKDTFFFLVLTSCSVPTEHCLANYIVITVVFCCSKNLQTFICHEHSEQVSHTKKKKNPN